MPRTRARWPSRSEGGGERALAGRPAKRSTPGFRRLETGYTSTLHEPDHRRRASPHPRLRADYLCPIGPSFLVPGLTDLAGWNKPDHYRSIRYGDLDGDGADEMVARGAGGVEVYSFRADVGQWSQVAVAPILPDRDGWGDPKYNRTMRLGDVDGDGKAELVIRSKDGVIVFRYVQGSSPDKGSWTQLTTSGPFTDPGWGAKKYYSTIELSPIGRVGARPTMQLVARGALGLGTWRWNGAGWTPLTGLTDLSDANGWDDPAYYLNIMAWDPSLLLALGPDGVRVYRYTAQAAGPGSWKLLTASGPCPAVPDRGNEVRFLCDPDTLELARGIRGVASGDPVLLARASRPGQGLRLTPFDVGRGQWRFTDAGVGRWHEKAYDEPRSGGPSRPPTSTETGRTRSSAGFPRAWSSSNRRSLGSASRSGGTSSPTPSPRSPTIPGRRSRTTRRSGRRGSTRSPRRRRCWLVARRGSARGASARSRAASRALRPTATTRPWTRRPSRG